MSANLVIGFVHLKDGKKDSKNENFSGIIIISPLVFVGSIK